jgi:hypothetical protein
MNTRHTGYRAVASMRFTRERTVVRNHPRPYLGFAGDSWRHGWRPVLGVMAPLAIRWVRRRTRQPGRTARPLIGDRRHAPVTKPTGLEVAAGRVEQADVMAALVAVAGVKDQQSPSLAPNGIQSSVLLFRARLNARYTDGGAPSSPPARNRTRRRDRPPKWTTPALRDRPARRQRRPTQHDPLALSRRTPLPRPLTRSTAVESAVATRLGRSRPTRPECPLAWRAEAALGRSALRVDMTPRRHTSASM